MKKDRILRRLAALAAVLACPAALAMEALPARVPTVAIVDTSGSMLGRSNLDWLAESLTGPAARGHDTRPREYGLVTFLETPKVVALGDGDRMQGAANALGDALRRLRAGGGIEDGYAAMQFVLDRFQPIDGAPIHLLLVTDEDRDAVGDVDGYRLSERLSLSNVVVDVVVSVRFRCEDGTQALGMNSLGQGILPGADDTRAVCAGAAPSLADPLRRQIVRDYVDLALNTGGAAWDLTALRRQSARADRALFAAALAARSDALQARLPAQVYVDHPSAARPGEPVTFDASASMSDGGELSFEWDLDGDSVFETGGTVVAAVFDQPGLHAVTLRVSDAAGAAGVVESRLQVRIAP